MRRAVLENHLSQDELRRRMIESEDREQFQRWQALFMVSKGLTADKTAEYVGSTSGTVHQWIFRYNHGGPERFVLRGRGGRRFGLLSMEEEEMLLAELRAQAEQGGIVAAFAIRTQVESKVGKPVSKDYLYDLLHRHGWRKVAPRPKHPKAKKEEQEEFKKNFPASWRPPRQHSLRGTPDR
jgi:transposase